MDFNYEIKAKMIERAEVLSGVDNKLLVLTLENGSIIVGHSLGIDPDEDEDEDILMFKSPDLENICWFRDSQIKSVELAQVK